MRWYRHIHIDGYIYPEIEDLNLQDVKSAFCCSGHPGRNMQPYAVFNFSERTAKLLCAAKFKGIYVELSLTENAGKLLIVVRRPFALDVKYRHCRMFKQYLRNVLDVITEEEQEKLYAARLLSSALSRRI